jgi:hypothetical protein
MAITKIHPIKTTLEVSINYICDAKKTDEEILISTFMCGHKTAALQFDNTRELMNSSCKNLARHLIQSFMPNEVSPELAHQIGQELCEKHLKGKYEYVLTTHVDKGHIHNHILFNNVSFVDGKAYASNKKSYHEIRRISDDICRSNQLSIASEQRSSRAANQVNGISYKEYYERKRGNSYKAKLQYSIDSAIRAAKDWDDFLRILRDNGYEIKQGKHIAFRAKGQERFTRSKTIGPDYTEEKIKYRLSLPKGQKRHSKIHKLNASHQVVDIARNQLARESEGFARWLKLQNLKSMSRSLNNMSVQNISDINSFYAHVNQLHDELGQIQNDIKTREAEIHNLAEQSKNIMTYKKYLPLFSGYEKAKDKDAYLRQYEREIILFEAARESLKSSNFNLSALPATEVLQKEISGLSAKIESLAHNLDKKKSEVSKINELRSNLEIYLKNERATLQESSKEKH